MVTYLDNNNILNVMTPLLVFALFNNYLANSGIVHCPYVRTLAGKDSDTQPTMSHFTNLWS